MNIVLAFVAFVLIIMVLGFVVFGAFLRRTEQLEEALRNQSIRIARLETKGR